MKRISKEEIKSKPINCPKCGSDYIVISEPTRSALCKGKNDGIVCDNIWSW